MSETATGVPVQIGTVQDVEAGRIERAYTSVNALRSDTTIGRVPVYDRPGGALRLRIEHAGEGVVAGSITEDDLARVPNGCVPGEPGQSDGGHNERVLRWAQSIAVSGSPVVLRLESPR